MTILKTLSRTRATLTGLNHLFRLEKFIHPDDDFAATEGEWVEVCRIWGHIQSIGPVQQVQNMLVEKHVTHTITSRYDPRVPLTNESLRLVDLTCSERAYNVEGFADFDELHERYVWEAVEVRS